MTFSHLYSTHTFQQTAEALVWEQQTAPYDNLIVSWNIPRPKRGSYHIFISVHAGEWSDWFPYAEWGANTQKTFESKGVFANCYQDTIAILHGKTADAFRIKLEASSGAPLTTYAFFASASHLKFFQQTPIPALPAIELPLRSLRSQMRLDHPRHRSLCSPTSLSMAIDWLAKRRKTNPIVLAEKVRDQHFDIYGNWILNIAESYHRLGKRFACRALRLEDFTALHEHLMRGLPVVVSVKGPLQGAPLPYAEGHLILVRGWDPKEQKVLCADPAFASDQEVLTSYDGQDFLTAWGRRFNLAYLFTPQEE